MHEDRNEWISSYIDNELTEEERLQVEIHLQNCRPCHQIVNELREVQRRVFQTYQEVELPAFFEEQVFQAIANNKPLGVRDTLFIKGGSLVYLGVTVLLCFLVLFSPLGTLISVIGSIGFHLFMSIFKAVPNLFYDMPPLLYGIGLMAILLLGLSTWSLKRLLVVKESL